MTEAMEPLDPQSAHSRAGTFAVLDARGSEAFARGHLAGSGHIPREDLLARRSELPPREAAILVVAETAAAAAASAAALEALGYSAVCFLDAPLVALPGGLDDRAPATPLWRPAPFLEEVLPRISQPRGVAREPGPAAESPRLALDLACGAGRDAVFLAQHGFEVEGWDHAPEALGRVHDLARRHGVTVRTVLHDLERPGLPLPARPFDLIVCFRFLHRPLFPWIEQALAPGGWLVYETYRAGQERFHRPRRAQFLLAPGELARAFPTLETIRCEERDPGSGPVTARLLARKPDRP
jgi:SAM-dependent methyltransferase